MNRRTEKPFWFPATRWNHWRARLSTEIQVAGNTLARWISPGKAGIVVIGLDGTAAAKQGPSLTRAELGRTELLVYGDCACGWRMAAPEGSLWPHCPNCGHRVLPPRPWVLEEEGQIRLGYVARLEVEKDAIEEILEMKGRA